MIGAILGYLAYLLIEATLFGTVALLLSRKGKDSYDTLKAIILIVVMLIVQTVLMTPMLNYADLKINNSELVSLLGTADLKDLMGFDVTGIIMNLIEAGIGIFLGKKVLRSAGL